MVLVFVLHILSNHTWSPSVLGIVFLMYLGSMVLDLDVSSTLVCIALSEYMLASVYSLYLLLSGLSWSKY
jgi:hypothetical protein